MLKHIFSLIVLLSLTMSACAQLPSINPSPTPSSGIDGTVSLGPMCPGPVPVGGNTCPDQPYQAKITILNSENKQVAQIETDAAGHFTIPLPAGTYTLHPEPGKPFPVAADQTVVVTDGQYTLVTIQYDTGMR